MSLQAQSVNMVVYSESPLKPALEGEALMQALVSGRAPGRGCVQQIDWQEQESAHLGFCRVRLDKEDIPRDHLHVIQHGISLDITLVEGDVKNSVTATCSNGEWHIANAICHYSKHQESNTGEGFNGVQTKYNAEYQSLIHRFKDAIKFNKK